MEVCSIRLDNYPTFWTEEEGVRVQKKMVNQVICDGCEAAMQGSTAVVYQMTLPKMLLFFCAPCKRKMER
jgi:hypothetical protein